MTDVHPDIRWFAMLLRRVCLLVVAEVEEKYNLPRSVVPKRDRVTVPD